MFFKYCFLILFCSKQHLCFKTYQKIVLFLLFQMLEIRAVLDAEPEVNETFTVTLSNPTGGARLGDQLQIFVTVLENLAPSGLFRIGPTVNRSHTVTPKGSEYHKYLPYNIMCRVFFFLALNKYTSNHT